MGGVTQASFSEHMEKLNHPEEETCVPPPLTTSRPLRCVQIDRRIPITKSRSRDKKERHSLIWSLDVYMGCAFSILSSTMGIFTDCGTDTSALQTQPPQNTLKEETKTPRLRSPTSLTNLHRAVHHSCSFIILRLFSFPCHSGLFLSV